MSEGEYTHTITTEPITGLIYKKIPLIMAEVGSIEKGRKNEQQGYKFRGVDDVYAALQLVMAKHGVFVVPEVLPDYSWTEHPTRSGGVMNSCRSRIKHTFYAEDGSSIESITFGEGMDSGDKSANKAMSVAIKYAMLEVFCIPTSDPKDPENGSPEIVQREQKEPAAPPSAEAKWTPATEQEKQDWAEGGRVTFDAQMEVWKKQLGPKNYHEWLQLFGIESKAEVNDPNWARYIYKRMKAATERGNDAQKRT